MPKTEATLEKVREALEEELEFSNVTDLRQGFLGAVERLQKTPALRFLVLKHGRPQAVLMSFQTYELVKKVMNQVLAGSVGAGREEAMWSAFERLQAERPAARHEPTSVAEITSDLNTPGRSSKQEHVSEGAVLMGRVKRLTDYGAFVDLGGIDGLLHITDMSWGRVTDPGDLLHVGDDIRVKVLKYDKEKQRVSLGVKQLTPKGSRAEVEVSKPSASKLAE